ncbi:MAG: sulfite reductase [bacterium]|nr:sulfite reductase [bacterium]
MEKIISKQSVFRWLEELDDYTIHVPAPMENNGDPWGFQVIRDPGAIGLDYSNTSQPPKKVVFPQREILFQFSPGKEGNGNEGMEIKENLPGEKSHIIMGLRPCDARAMTHLEKIFREDEVDPYYDRRRERTFLVGMGCASPPSDNCFCTGTGGAPHDKTGLDILLTDLGDDLYLETLNPKGVKLLDVPGKLFKVPKTEERNKMRKLHADSAGLLEREIKEPDTVSARLAGMFGSDFWDKESMSCIGCGICTYLCPSCHCFDITDEVEEISPLKGKRVRNWDNCQFPDFTMHSSGHNPRPDKASRLRRRILHKFHYFAETHGEFLCTGCGRCVSKCPVGIDIVEMLNKVETNG